MVAVRDLLTDLMGRSVTAKLAQKPIHAVPGTRTVAVYLRATGAVGAVGISDIAGATYLGAALSLVPPGVAAQAHKKGVLDDALLENYGEIVNVAASLFNVSGGPHVKLSRVYVVPPTSLPPEIASVLPRTTRLDLDVTVPGYGAGKFSLVVA